MDLGFLKKKELGLPLWAWALIVAVLMYLLYRHYKNSAANASAASTTAPDTTGTSTGALDTSGGGSGDFSGGGGGPSGDNSGALSALAADLAPEGQYYQSLLDAGQGLIDPGLQVPDPNASVTPTDTASTNPLSWGGTSFTTRAQFNAWLGSHGGSLKQFAVTHPAAYAQYLGLPAGVQSKGTKSSVLASVKKVQGTAKSGVSRTVGQFKTLKSQVKLSAGQSVHYTPGKGYYAAAKTPASSKPPAKSVNKPVVRKPITPTYYTYKSQVRLGQGQTLHYTKGRGYYA